MSVSGIDFGNQNLLISQTAKGGVDVLLNGSSNRQNATYVSIQGKQRFLADAGAAMARSNVKNTISKMKLLVGRQYDDKSVQDLCAKLPYNTTKLPNGGVGISITYNDETLVISAEHAMAMMLVQAQKVSSDANGGLNIADAVLAVPYWFTEAQRKGVLIACEIAGLNCIKVTNESNAIALGYGIFKSAKKLFSETEPTFIMFVDIGYSQFSVCIVEFIQEQMKVRSCVSNRELHGSALDDIIIEFLAESFETKHKINVRNNIKAMLKLEAAAEKAKKTLSPAGVKEVNVNVECLAEDIDLAVILTRDEFEKRAAHLIAKIKPVVECSLAEAGLSKEQIREVEVVGGSTRVNIIKRTLGEVMGLDASAMNYGLKTTMNADEAVARGAALQCAMLSSRMKVKPFNIVDKIPYGIVAHFENASSGESGEDGKEQDGEDGTAAKGTCVALYSHNDDLPHKPRRLTFRNKTSDFSVTLAYDEAATALLPEGETHHLGKYTIKMPERPADAPPSDVRITWNLDKNGFVYVQSAQLLEEVVITPEEAAAAASSGEGKDEAKNGEQKAADASEAPKKRFKKNDLQYTAELPGLTKEEVRAAIELEASMAFEDKMLVETADKRNELESYIYAMRDKVDGELKEFVTAADKGVFKAAITEAEDWLYGDGFDSTKSEYSRRIDSLRALGDPIERRFSENLNRPASIDGLKKQLEMCKTFTSKYTEDTAHITEEERDSLRKAIGLTEDWMYDSIGKQGELPLHANPILSSDAISAKRNELFKLSNPIMTKPKPKPAPKPEENNANPPPAPEKDAKMDVDGEADKKDTSPGPTDQADGSVPMEQCKDGPDDAPQEK